MHCRQTLLTLFCGTCLAATGLTLGCQKPEAPPATSTVATIALPNDDALRDRIDPALDFTFAKRHLNSKDHAAWQVVHGILSYGKDFQINHNDIEISRLAASKRFRLEYIKDVTFEQDIENATDFTGSFLKKIREYKNVTLERMSDLTKISKTYLLQIEKDDFDKLPALAYIRGFVYQYAKVLKLGPDLVATSYLNHLKNQAQKNKSGKI